MQAEASTSRTGSAPLPSSVCAGEEEDVVHRCLLPYLK